MLSRCWNIWLHAEDNEVIDERRKSRNEWSCDVATGTVDERWRYRNERSCAVGVGTVDKRWGYRNVRSCAGPGRQGEENKFALKRINGNSIPYNQSKDGVLLLKRKTGSKDHAVPRNRISKTS